jgi:hypothetical protein
MAQSYSFDRKDVDDLIEILIHLGKSSINAILDTGATHAIINLGVLIKEGYRLNDSKGIVFIETANCLVLWK